MRTLELNVGDRNLTVFINEYGGQQYVAISPICQALGLAENKQRQRVMGNPQFTAYHMVSRRSDGQEVEMLCIPVEEIGMWLCTINANKVKASIKDGLILFQRKLQVVIHDALTGKLDVQLLHSMAKELREIRLRLEVVEEENRIYKARSFDPAVSYAATTMVNKRWANKERNLFNTKVQTVK